MRMLFAYAFSMLADYLLRTDRLSRTNVRKLATFICKYKGSRCHDIPKYSIRICHF